MLHVCCDLNMSWIILASALLTPSLTPSLAFLNPAKQRVHSLPGSKQLWVTQSVRGLCSRADPANTLSCPTSSPVSPPPATWPASGAALFVCSATASCWCHWVNGLICVTRTAAWITLRLCSRMTSTKSYFLFIATSLLGSSVVNVESHLSFGFG